MSFIETIKSRAKANQKTIVLPESGDMRTITAAANILAEGIADIILIGGKDEIIKKAGGMDLSKAAFIDPLNYEKSGELAGKLFELRKSKGLSEEDAAKLVKEPLYLSVMLVKEGIADGELREAVNQLEAGQAVADLGGGVYKVRMARQGEGKSGGYRAIVFFRSGDRTFYAYGFAKADMGNISEKQLRDFKRTAKAMLALTERQLEDVLKTGKYLEI
jgi:hypothetical protein